ncbi:uncharacterized protein CANTADRAFT_4224 [Suhomyces tanzawaensis NRRL Y-17324]|uniref:Membrane magnesium transporter n=1 Tax=Suhomyces tanzawaensis NRRL Y-17324 TaxID=984487 RepID=A0A1E4SRZ8_9ASCO|nr:uncharacterized protein CANTADRAFT_4224 [Suhomyces tanzawaensis NRRL Y-17324]ODV82197.1 hypothetical protein CANTADRAFT_4224 [Suhomyces tanzawaensis NRRL Y-17324]
MSSVLYIVGGVLVLHAAYSSMEFHLLAKSMHQECTFTTVPSDIIHETVYGLVLIILGAIRSVRNEVAYTVEGSESSEGALKGININVAVKQDHEYLRPIEMKRAVAVSERIGLNDYAEFESRVDFVDLVEKRKEFNQWSEAQ